jgi:hypothetical protein
MLLALIVVSLGAWAFADREALPSPKQFASASGQFVFYFAPAEQNFNGKVERDAFGVAYRVGENGKLQEIWRLEKWYAFEAFISDDGEYLVCMGGWPIGDEPSKDDLAVAFFHRGSCWPNTPPRIW